MSDKPTHNFDMNNAKGVCKDVCDVKEDGEEKRRSSDPLLHQD